MSDRPEMTPRERCDGANCRGHPFDCYGHPNECGCTRDGGDHNQPMSNDRSGTTEDDRAPNQIDLARQFARILGDSCAAARAVHRYEAIIASGFPSRIFLAGNRWFVEEPPHDR